MTVRGRADNPNENPAQIVRRIYDAKFLEQLGQQFKFDGKDPEIAQTIIRMGVSYIRLRRLEDTSDIGNSRRRAVSLKRAINSFRLALKKGEELDLPQLMTIAALQSNYVAPDDIQNAEIAGNGDAYFRGFLRLLEILEKGVSEEVRRSSGKPGPRVNWGLETLAIQASQFFLIELTGRPFTIDQHKPFKATEAFDFVKALVDPLDDVTQNDIISAIRSAKSQLKKSRN